jgi:hypothetical protein
MSTASLQNLLHKGRQNCPTEIQEPPEAFEAEAFEEGCLDEPVFLGESPEPVPDPLAPEDVTTLGLVELILKDRSRLDQAIRDPKLQRLLVQKFLTIALLSFLLFGICLAIMLNSSGVWPKLTAMKTVFEAAEAEEEISFLEFVSDPAGAGRWLDGSALKLILAYSLGLIAATGVCLPSLYFYGLLAGVRMRMTDVVLHTLKAQATGAVGLIGILPMYTAVGMGVIIVARAGGSVATFEPGQLLTMALWLGLILPFIGGLFGTWSMHRGFTGLADTIAVEHRAKRECFLNRLSLSWIAVYTAVTPLMIFTLWEFFSRT